MTTDDKFYSLSRKGRRQINKLRELDQVSGFGMDADEVLFLEILDRLPPKFTPVAASYVEHKIRADYGEDPVAAIRALRSGRARCPTEEEFKAIEEWQAQLPPLH
jgi:hypothetical protein